MYCLLNTKHLSVMDNETVGQLDRHTDDGEVCAYVGDMFCSQDTLAFHPDTLSNHFLLKISPIQVEKTQFITMAS